MVDYAMQLWSFSCCAPLVGDRLCACATCTLASCCVTSLQPSTKAVSIVASVDNTRVGTLTLRCPCCCRLPLCLPPAPILPEEAGIPVPSTKRGEPPFSMDANLLHISYEGNALEDPWAEPDESMFTRSVSPEDVSGTELLSWLHCLHGQREGCIL